MRKFYSLIISFLLSIVGVFAQVDKGTITIGSSLNLNISNTIDGKIINRNFGIGLNPSIGYFLIDHLEAGLEFPLSISKSKNEDNYKNTKTETFSTRIGIGPYLRYYFLPIDEFAIFIHGSFGFSFGNIENKNNGITTKNDINLWGYQFFPGVVFFPTQNLGIEIFSSAIGFSHSKETVNSTSKQTNSKFSINPSLQYINAGVKYFFLR